MNLIIVGDNAYNLDYLVRGIATYSKNGTLNQYTVSFENGEKISFKDEEAEKVYAYIQNCAIDVATFKPWEPAAFSGYSGVTYGITSGVDNVTIDAPVTFTGPVTLAEEPKIAAVEPATPANPIPVSGEVTHGQLEELDNLLDQLKSDPSASAPATEQTVASETPAEEPTDSSVETEEAVFQAKAVSTKKKKSTKAGE